MVQPLDQPPGELPGAPAGAAASLSRSRIEGLPKEIGPFHLLHRIGEGGMGVVFLARQERPQRTVALKVIHAAALSSASARRRFELESELLARLQHPGIAQIYQAGTYETPQGVLPYFAMEYVEGQRLDVHARERTLSTRARLELAARIADAVEHAHQKGVIHRDLKPGNILVTAEGQPKILDFGVARLADAGVQTTTLRTDVGALLGTLPYMSPEQASGDPAALDTRSDVYSLGVVFYELLAGRLPYHVERRALPEAVRVIQEEEPSRLSTHDRRLRGDVETIVLKALEKDKARRYASASALAADIRHFLADEPIAARRPSAGYQLRKFARRNKALVGGVLAVLLALIAGTVAASMQAWRARRAEQLAVERLERAEIGERKAQQVAAFLRSLLAGIDPAVAQGADTTLLQRILEQARSRIAGELAGQPEVEAEIRQTLGSVYEGLGLFTLAEEELRAAERILLERFGPDDRRTLEVRDALAGVLVRLGEHARAEEVERETLQRQEAALGAGDPDAQDTRRGLADTLMRQGRFREAVELLRTLLAEQRESSDPEGELTLATMVSLGQSLSYSGRLDEAQALFEDVLFVRSEKLGDDHPGTIVALECLAEVLAFQDKLDEAEEAHLEALERARRVWGVEHDQTFSIQNNLAVVLRTTGRLAEAEALVREVLAGRRKVLGEEHALTFETMGHLGIVLRELGRDDEAEALFREAHAGLLRLHGDDHSEVLGLRWQLAKLHKERRRYHEAAEMLGEIAAHNRRVLAEDDPARALSLYNWAGTLQDAGELEAAEAPLREALELVERHGLEREAFVPAAQNGLAKSLEGRGEHAEADELFRAALETRRRWYGKVHSEVLYSLSDYGETLLERGDLAQAEPLLAENLESRRALARPDDWEFAGAQALLGRCHSQLGRHGEAEPLLLQACELFERVEGRAAFEQKARGWLIELYEAWDAAAPGQGLLERATRWRASALDE